MLGLHGKLRFAKTALGDEDAESREVRDGKLPHHHRFSAYAVLSATLQKAMDFFCNGRNHKNCHASSPCAARSYKLLFSTSRDVVSCRTLALHCPLTPHELAGLNLPCLLE
jgi:hypothetical protein